MKKNNPQPDQINAAILAAIRSGAAGRSNAYANRRALLAKASWFADFDHFTSFRLGTVFALLARPSERCSLSRTHVRNRFSAGRTTRIPREFQFIV